MAEEPNFLQINYYGKEMTFSDRNKAECKTEIKSDEINKVLCVEARPFCAETEVIEGKIKYKGKIVYCATVIDNENRIKKCECLSEYSGEIEDPYIKENAAVLISANTEKAEYDLSGTLLSFSSSITVTAKIKSQSELKALEEAEGIITKKGEVPYYKNYGVKKGNTTIEEEFTLNYQISEVLSQCVNVSVTDVQCGVGALIVDGELFLSATLLQNTEGSGIIKEDKVLPFRTEIDYEEAVPTMTGCAFLSVKSVKTDISVEEETGKSTVTLSVTLCYSGEAFSEESFAVIEDAFSISNELNLQKSCVTFYSPSILKTFRDKVGGRITVDEIPLSSTITAVGNCGVEKAQTSIENGKITLDGGLNFCIFFNGEDGVFAKKGEIPFSLVSDIDSGAEGIDVSVIPVLVTAKIISATEIEVEAELSVSVFYNNKSEAEFVENIEVGAEKEKDNCPLSVYIAINGEDLWSLSKRLNVSPEALNESNRELQFPLTGEERIVVYRQK